ncbi:MAG: signal recognition particle-docking protein FtsY [Gammaproteobacteria bacterium WSBS_2016_MAG_OTU1]
MGRLFGGLIKTRTRISAAAAAASSDEAVFAALQDGLIMADVGVRTAADIIQAAQARMGDISPAQKLTAEISLRLRRVEASLAVGGQTPFVIMVMGVNGGGKTTTIAKLCRRFVLEGKKVLLAAGDTFRAAAQEQLQAWAGKLGEVEFVAANDPGAAAFDGVQAGIARGCDIVLIDTSGRLPSQPHLMAELGKIRRAASKALPGAPHELLLILDATLGRNTLQQIEAFTAAVGVTGLALTKLDGSAKGGFLLEMAANIPRPVRFVGLGEGADDLERFNGDEYARALSGEE